MTGTLPNFLIVGAMKSGTTSLANWLGAHPDAYMAPGKEVHFFDVDQNWALGIDWYREIFAGASGQTAVGEGTPRYMFLERAVDRMAQTLPEAKLIVCLRDPIGRAYSHWLHAYHRNARDRRSFEQAMRDEMAGPEVFECESIDGGYLTRGQYARQLERLERHYPRDRIQVVFFEDLLRDPAASFDDVCRYLDIATGVRPDNLGSKDNPAATYRPLWLWRQIRAYRRFERMPRRIAGRLERAMKRPLTKTPIDPAVQQMLAEYFEPHTAALERWLGHEVSGWTRAG